MYCKLFLTLPSDTTVITANRRLALHLQQFNRPEEPHPILDFESWLLELWSSHSEPKLKLLDETEEAYLWQLIIRANLKDYPLLKLTATSKLVQQAWKNLKLWRKNLTELDVLSSQEVQQFKQWAEEFQKYQQQHHSLSFSELIPALLSLQQKQALKLPKQLLLVGFDEIPPLYQYFFEKLSSKIKITQYFPETRSNHPIRLSLRDSKEEILLMARWAQAYLIQNPNASIGCIIPELRLLQTKVRRIFDEVFHPNLPKLTYFYEKAFNISAGQSLSQFNMIRCALSLLNINPNKLEIEVLSELIRSPYINASLEDSLLATELDIDLRNNAQRSSIKFEQVILNLKKLKQSHTHADFDKRWGNFCQTILTNLESRLPSQWAQLFKIELATIGWPGLQKLHTEEYALLEAWEEILIKLSSFDPISGELSRFAALELLANLCSAQIFQVQTKDKPIQILGILEASGLNFDALWIMGLSDRSWPPQAQINPFIPYYQQRSWNMPHASNQRELNYAHQVQKRLLNSADTIILSYPQTQNEITQGPSALIKNFPELNLEEFNQRWKLQTYISKTEQLFKLRELETLEDQQAPLLTEEENIHGGSFLIKEQAICPFRAFARLRLYAHSLPKPELGLSAITKGNLTHKALEIFWKKIRTHTQLCELKPEELDREIRTAVNQAIKNLSQSSSFIKVEQQRLILLLTDWMNLEKKRDPFKVIAQEALYQIELNQLKLNLRIDRIDELEDGSYLIIDYKTGFAQISDWFEDRMIEPQLPLYCSYAFTQADAIAFAQLKAGNIKLKGVAAGEKNLDSVIPLDKLRYEIDGIIHWHELVHNWQTKLKFTAEEFISGEARVDPYDPATHCAQCDLQGLCRVGE